MQNDILPQISLIPGLTYISDFLSTEDHDYLWKKIYSDGVWSPLPLRRRVQQYGYYYDYRNQIFDLGFIVPSIPDWLKKYTKKLLDLNIFSSEPNHVLINEYKQNGIRNWSIPPHTDSSDLFGDTIASISLGAPCIVEFSKTHPEKEVPVKLQVFPSSLYVMKKEVRYSWIHKIPDKKYNKLLNKDAISNIRISITIREAKTSQ